MFQLNENKIRELIAEKKLSVRKFCKLAGINESTWYKLFNKKYHRQAQQTTVEKICNALNCSPEEIYA